MFGDSEEEMRDHHYAPDIYTAIFALSARVIESWLAPPRPIEVPPPVPINLWELAVMKAWSARRQG